DGQSIPSGHAYVQEDAVRAVGCNRGESLVRAACLGDDAQVLLHVQQCPQARSHDGAVVDDDDTDLIRSTHDSISPSRWTRRVTRVPRPGEESTSAVPPTRAIRSRIPLRP